MPKRILIVEDEIFVRNAVRIFLEHHSPFEVCGEAANGVEAVDKAAALQPDLVGLKNDLPGAIDEHKVGPQRQPLAVKIKRLEHIAFGDELDAAQPRRVNVERRHPEIRLFR